MTRLSNESDLVSVLIPCSETTFLRETLESVLVQSYRNLEIVVVLNGSAITERAELVGVYANKVKFLTCEESGIVAALNFGLLNSEGPLIARIDADDLMPIGRIERQVNFLRMNSDVVCVGGQLEYITSDKFQPPHPGYPLDDSKIRHNLYRFSAIPHPGMMYRKEEVQKCGGYSAEFPLIEDWVLLTKLAGLYKLANLSEVVVYYRIHPTQSTKSNFPSQQTSIVAFARKRLIKGISDLVSPKPKSGKILEFRRTLAGFLYTKAKNQHSGKNKRASWYFLSAFALLIDPRLISELIRKLFSRIILR